MNIIDIPRDQHTRLLQRFLLAEEYIRLRDVIRLRAEVGLDIPTEVPQQLKAMEERFDALDPRIPRPREDGRVRFPDWAQR